MLFIFFFIVGWFVANTYLSESISFPIVTTVSIPRLHIECHTAIFATLDYIFVNIINQIQSVQSES
jgi:hypothetical protein